MINAMNLELLSLFFGSFFKLIGCLTWGKGGSACGGIAVHGNLQKPRGCGTWGRGLVLNTAAA